MYKQFTTNNQNTYEYKSNKTFNLTQSDITRHQFLSASSNSVSKSYYDFARINFYFSGSHINETAFNESFTIGNDGTGKKTFLNKFFLNVLLISLMCLQDFLKAYPLQPQL